MLEFETLPLPPDSLRNNKRGFDPMKEWEADLFLGLYSDWRDGGMWDALPCQHPTWARGPRNGLMFRWNGKANRWGVILIRGDSKWTHSWPVGRRPLTVEQIKWAGWEKRPLYFKNLKHARYWYANDPDGLKDWIAYYGKGAGQ